MQTPTPTVAEGSVEPVQRFLPLHGLSVSPIQGHVSHRRWVLPPPLPGAVRGLSEVRSASGPAGGVSHVQAKATITPARRGFGLEPLVDSLTKDKLLLQKLHLEGQVENAQLRKQVQDLAEAFREHLNGTNTFAKADPAGTASPATPSSALQTRGVSPERRAPMSPLADLSVNMKGKDCAKCPALLKEIQANRKEANKLRKQNIKTATAADAWQLKAELVESDLAEAKTEHAAAKAVLEEQIRSLEASLAEETTTHAQVREENARLRALVDAQEANTTFVQDLRQHNETLLAQVEAQQRELTHERSLLVTELEMFRRKVASIDVLRATEAAAKEAAEERLAAAQSAHDAAARQVARLTAELDKQTQRAGSVDALHAEVQQLSAALIKAQQEKEELHAKQQADGEAALKARMEELIAANTELVRLHTQPAQQPSGDLRDAHGSSDVADYRSTGRGHRSEAVLAQLDTDAAALRRQEEDLEQERVDLCRTLQAVHPHPHPASPASPRRAAMFGAELPLDNRIPPSPHRDGTPTAPPLLSVAPPTLHTPSRPAEALGAKDVEKLIDVKQRLAAVAVESVAVRRALRKVETARARVTSPAPKDCDAQEGAVKHAEDETTATAEELQHTLAALRHAARRAATADAAHHTASRALSDARDATDAAERRVAALDEKLETAHAAATRQREALAQENATLADGNKAVMRQLEDVHADNKRLALQHTDTVRQRDTAEAELRAAQHLLADRQKAVDEAAAKYDAAVAEREVAQQQRDSIGAELKAFQVQLGSLTAQLKDMEQSRAAFARETHDAKQAAQTQEIERTKLESEVKALRERVAEKVATTEAQQAKIKALKDKIRQHEAVKGDLEKLKDRLRQEREQREAAQREAAEVQENHQVASRQVEIQNQQIETMKIELDVLETQLDQTRSSMHTHERAALDAQDAVEALNHTLENVTGQYEHDNNRMASQLAQLRRVAEEECAAKQVLQNELDATVASLESQSSADAELLNDMQDAMQLQRDETEAARTAHEERLQALNAAYAREKKELQQELRTTVSVADSFQKELGEERAAMEEKEALLKSQLAELATKYNEERATVETALAEASRRCEDLGSTVNTLEADMDSERAERRREKQAAQAEIAALNARLADMHTQHTAETAAVHAAKAEMQNGYESRIEEVKATAAAQREAAEAKIQAAEQRAASVKADLGRTIALLEDTVGRAGEEKMSLMEQSRALTTEVERLQTWQEEELATLRREIAAEKEARERAEQRTVDAEMEVEVLKGDVAKLSHEAAEHFTELAGVKQTAEAAATELAVLEQSYSALADEKTAEAAVLEQSYTALVEEKAATKTALETEIASLEAARTTLYADKLTVAEDLRATEAEVAALRSTKDELEKEVEEKKALAEQLQVELGAVQEQSLQAQHSADSMEALLRETVAKHEEERERLQQLFGEQEEEKEELRGSISSLRDAELKATTELNEELHDVKAKLAERNMEYEAVQEQLNSTVSEMQTVFGEKDILASKQRGELEATVRELEAGLTESTEECRALWKKTEELRGELASGREHLAAAQAQRAAVQEEMKKMGAKLARAGKSKATAVQRATDRLAEAELKRAELKAQHAVLLQEFAIERDSNTEHQRLTRELEALLKQERLIAEDLLQKTQSQERVIDVLKSSIASHEASVAKAQHETAAARESLEVQRMDSMGEKEMLRAKVKAQTGEITLLMDEVTAFKTLGHAETADLKQQIRGLNAELAETAGKVNAQAALLKVKDLELLQNTAELKSQNEQLRLANATFEGRCETLTRRLGAAEEEVRALATLRVPAQLAAEAQAAAETLRSTSETAVQTEGDALAAEMEWKVQQAEYKRQGERHKELQNDMRTEMDRLKHELGKAQEQVAAAENKWDESEVLRMAAEKGGQAQEEEREGMAKKLSVFQEENAHLHDEIAEWERRAKSGEVARQAAVDTAVKRAEQATTEAEGLNAENTSLRGEVLLLRKHEAAHHRAVAQLREWKSWVAGRRQYAPVDHLLKRCAAPQISSETAELVADCLTWHHSSDAASHNDFAAADDCQRAATPSHLIRT